MRQAWGKIKPSAQYAGVCDRTVRYWLKNGLVHSRLPSGTILIKFEEIDKFLESFVVSSNQADALVDEVLKDLQ